MTTAITLAGGNLIFLAFIVIAFFGLVLGYFTVKGSGITPRSTGRCTAAPRAPSSVATRRAVTTTRA